MDTPITRQWPCYVMAIGIFGGEGFTRVVYVASDLYQAAGYLHGDMKMTRPYSLAVRDGETGERWSFNELKDGGFMHDFQ